MAIQELNIKDTLKHVLKNSIVTFECLEAYAIDKSHAAHKLPDCVVQVHCVSDIPIVLKFAYKNTMPVTVRAAGTGVTGGAIPEHAGIVLDLSKLNKILEVDTENRVVVVEPGVITADIHRVVEAKNLFYPPDPASLDICTIGGNVAENSGGPRALKYGVTRDYVVGLEGYYSDGTPFKWGGKIAKNVAGYDLIGLLLGSEGTLAVISKIILKLIPLPNSRKTLLTQFKTMKNASNFLTQVCQTHIQPSLAEFMDDYCIQAYESFTDIHTGLTEKATVILEIDGHDEPSVIAATHALIKQAETFKGNVSATVLKLEDVEKIWHIRRHISPALKSKSHGVKVSEDIVVPLNKVSECLEKLHDLGAEIGVKVLGYGHLGDGNIHVNILKNDLSDKDWKAKKPDIIDAVLSLAVQLGGTISGEHGIGLTKKQYLNKVFSKKDIHVLKQIKNAFDPKNILNPGKIFPEDS